MTLEGHLLLSAKHTPAPLAPRTLPHPCAGHTLQPLVASPPSVGEEAWVQQYSVLASTVRHTYCHGAEEGHDAPA